MNHMPRLLNGTRKGAALQLTAAAIAAGAVAWAGITSVSVSSSSVPKAKLIKFRTPTTRNEIAASLGELGLTPKVLAAAGLSAEQTTAFTTAAAGYMRSHIADYRAASDTQFQANNEVDRLRRKVQGGTGSAEDVSALATAQSSLTAAIADRQAILESALSAGGAEIPSGSFTLLNTFRLNSRKWDLPEQFLGDNRSEANWMALTDAIANDAYATHTSQDPDAGAHQILLTAQSTTNAAAATSNFANLDAIKSAWLEAIGQ